MMSHDELGTASVFPVTLQNIILRPFRIEDSAVKCRLDGDLDIRNRLGSPSKLEHEIAEFEAKGYGLAAIVERQSDRIVGYAKLQAPEWQEALGLELTVAVSKEARRRGFALDAARALIRISCGLLHQKQIVGRVALSNPASLLLATRLGMAKIDEREDPWDGVQHVFAFRCPGA